MREHAVDLFGKHVLLLLVQQHFADDLFDKIVLFVDDLRFVALVQHVGQIDGVFFGDLLVLFEKFESVPALVDDVGILLFQDGDDLVQLVLDLIRIHHGIFRMVVVAVAGHVVVLVHQPFGRLVSPVVDGGVQQRIQPAALSRRDGHDGDAQHFGQAVHVDLHAALLHDVHHVQRHHDRFAQFEELQGKVQAALQNGRIDDVDDDVHFVAEDKVTRDRLLHRVGGEAVGTGKIDEVDLLVMVADGALHLFDGNARPVGDL